MPVMAVGVSHPAEILDSIAQGVDIFDSDYPLLLSQYSYASVFQLQPSEPSGSSHSGDDGSSAASTGAIKLNLRDPKFALDSAPILPGCRCYTCRTYTRAYVHHLLNTHEMLADVALFLHNMHHYAQFFEEIRRQLDAHTFSQYVEWFKSANKTI